MGAMYFVAKDVRTEIQEWHWAPWTFKTHKFLKIQQAFSIGIKTKTTAPGWWGRASSDLQIWSKACWFYQSLSLSLSYTNLYIEERTGTAHQRWLAPVQFGLSWAQESTGKSMVPKMFFVLFVDSSLVQLHSTWSRKKFWDAVLRSSDSAWMASIKGYLKKESEEAQGLPSCWPPLISFHVSPNHSSFTTSYKSWRVMIQLRRILSDPCLVSLRFWMFWMYR